MNNCLYYVHFNLPGEEPEEPEPRRSVDSGRSQLQIRRKPLPANSRAAPGLANASDTAGSPVEPRPASNPLQPDVAGSSGVPGAAPNLPQPDAGFPVELRGRGPADVDPRGPVLADPIPIPAPAIAFTSDHPDSSPTPSDPPPPYPGSLSPERRLSPERLPGHDEPSLRPVPPLRPLSFEHSHEARPDLPPRPRSQVNLRPETMHFGDPTPPPPPPHRVRFSMPSSPSDDFGSGAPPPMPPRPHAPQTHGVLSPNSSSPIDSGNQHFEDFFGSPPRAPRASAAHTQPPRSRSPSPAKAGTYNPYVAFSITIIRRDPSSGHQWNVGKVTSHQVETEEESGYIHQRPAYDAGPEPPPINMHIDNSGYCKFRGMPTRLPALDARPPHPAAAVADNRPSSADADGAFHRQAVMTYAKGFRTNIRERLRGPDPDSDPHPRGHARERSTDSADSDNEPFTQPGPGLRRQGYMFTSPWDGRCIFRTGNAGRSVVCRHVLPGQSSASNPLVPGSMDRRKAKLGVFPPVSELRFNLPVADLLKSRDEAAQQLHDHFNKLVRPKHGGGEGYSSDVVYSVLPFDLNLGKEKAGGGRRGRRAKLGKLIIYDEGMKMLDLVVAANMGIWWGAWEKSYWA